MAWLEIRLGTALLAEGQAFFGRAGTDREISLLPSSTRPPPRRERAARLRVPPVRETAASLRSRSVRSFPSRLRRRRALRKVVVVKASNLNDEHRPKCAGCGEPVELAYPDEPDNWIHAVDANYFGDHSAWLDEEEG